MLNRKSLNVLPGNTTTGKLWESYQPTAVSRIELSDKRSEGVKNYKGIIKLALGVLYFLSLVSALTVLLT